MSRRTKCTVKNVVASPFIVDGKRPFVFSAGGDEHWGGDSYGVRDLVSVHWSPMEAA